MLSIPKSLQEEILSRDQWLQRKDAPKYREAFTLTQDFPKAHFAIQDPFVVLEAGLSLEQTKRLMKAAEIFIPWRKGPWKLYNLEIDAEWRSDFKWNRFARKELFYQKKVLDIGCNNGYFLYRIAEYKPEFALGIDPIHRLKFAFDWISSFAPPLPIAMEMLGVEDLPLFQPVFDTVLLMGILYHRKDPISTLSACKSALKKGGKLVVECLTIPGEEPVALFAKERYLNMRNTYFIPTVSCLQNWLFRAGFTDITLCYDAKLDSTEQRKTKWAPVDSFLEFTDPMDRNKTIEGYPSQKRTIFIATKP
ncbi:MAG: tRNA 5-methoxyuridine(34)/uridine 5-oxyacetic acid(34) synthase CmoB [Candidatus Hydrogenedentota bacterium]|nr:MAG: tRNA 5-methoxyuridine(34)/uridine 5-oxyacetic acid(34) synthase CmoB [Candidatus Hydrogenedentota bacterium]